ncbi:hypothetical protein F4782DRAFT_118746 [Xylaria castorea]|nr:hypothetical protein F4782DRAFT_118746 [Xylaria castorea]
MWKVRGWFGSGVANKQEDPPKNAILGLRSQLEILRKREKYLTTQVEEQDIIARKNGSINKKAAKAALRRRKAHEHSLDQTIAQIRTLDLFAPPERSIIERPSKKGSHAPTKKLLRRNTARHSDSRSIGLRGFVRNWVAT